MIIMIGLQEAVRLLMFLRNEGTAGYLWHMDQDHMGLFDDTSVFIICSFDDAPRYFLHHEILMDKQAITTSTVLERTITQWHPPCSMTSDSGGEFIGAELPKTLKLFNIQQ
jgi:hypothetical protein